MECYCGGSEKMQINNVKSVLEAWRLIESLNPSVVPGKEERIKKSYFKDNQDRNRTQLIQLEEYPWEENQLKDDENYKVQYQYYMSCFEHYKLVDFIRGILKNSDEVINKDYKTLFGFSFSVDDEGNYITGSIFVPLLMYVMKRMIQNTENYYSNLLVQFEGQLKLFEEEIKNTLINGVTSDALIKVQQIYQRYFYQVEDSNINYLELKVVKADKKVPIQNFNSFYLRDLVNILEKGENEALRQFIEGVNTEKHIDINENREYIETILQPSRIPDGRWPSPVEHRLSLMQQVAVNQILNSNQQISSVNGPPGTGKTTLLKDIFANIVVERAKEIIKFKDPTQAFQKEKTIKVDDYHYPIYILAPNLRKYSMVVASSNNGAVENISKDLPKEEEVIRTSNEKEPNHYDALYAEEASELEMYSSVAQDLLGDEIKTWGLFSGVLGKSENIYNFGQALYKSKENGKGFIQQLEEESKRITLENWENAVEDFQNVFESILKKKEELQKFSNNYKVNLSLNDSLEKKKEQILIFEEEKTKIDDRCEYLEVQRKLTEQQIQMVPKLSFFKRLLGKKNVKKLELEKELNDIICELKGKQGEAYLKGEQIKDNKKIIEKIKVENSTFIEQQNYYKEQGVVLPSEEYWSNSKEAYEYRQLNTIWLTDELNFERGLLFLKAMKIHKLLLAFNFKAIKSTIRLLNNRTKLDLNDAENRRYLKNIWETIHLITPLVSTTFASFSSMYKGIGKDSINYLFIDEAGQASPQQAAGAIWRAKNVIVVGDPIQIEPVVTIDQTILGDIRKYFSIDNKYIDMGSSVQTLADLANPYGTFNNSGQWIGTPLWVHRRCLDPMFTIANEIAYENKMVLAQKERGKSVWFDCKGLTTDRQFVEQQGKLVIEHIVRLWTNISKPPNVYIISPFTAVKDSMKQELESKLKDMNISRTLIKNFLKNSIGTVHTFQGKEADIVYFITGTDMNSDSAANWSCSKHNLLNVAVTRAKKEFYVVGDYKRFSQKPYYKSIVDNVDNVQRENIHSMNK